VSAKSLSTLLTPGNVVAGKFRVERVLGKGGMGLIVAATHLQLEKPVALKFFRGDLGVDREAADRFLREARAAAQLRSEHVARVLDVGVTEDEIPYIVMEYLRGQPLDEIVGERGPLEVQNAVEIGIQVCEGLAEAHARGIIHRDVKPANLFLVEPSPGWLTTKILDFGISKGMTRATNVSVMLGTSRPTNGTANELVVGTPCYMSPEHLQSPGSIDGRADIWSLGASLHELLTGTPPFDPELDFPALANAIRNEPAPPLRTLRREIPPGLEAVVARCLEKDRTARFDSAADLALALLPYAPARAHVPAERAAALARGEGLASEPTAEPARPARPAPEAPPPGSEAAHRATNRTTNTITSRGIGTVAAESDDVRRASATAGSRNTLAPAPVADRSLSNGGADADIAPITATLPASPSDRTPNLKPPLLSKSLALLGGAVLAMVLGTLVLSQVGRHGASSPPATASGPLRPPSFPSPTIVPTAPEPAAPQPEPVAAPEMARAAAAPVRPVAQVGPPAAPPAAEVPKIAIGVSAADAAGRGRVVRATNAPRRSTSSGSSRDGGQSTVAASDGSATSRPARRTAPPSAASAAPPPAAASVARKTSVAGRPGAPPTEPPPARPMEQVDPAGGRVPQRSILTRNPYEAP
jgi:serine/threonine-protein kinase